MQDKFFRKLKQEIDQYTGPQRNNRKYVPILSEVLTDFVHGLPKPFVKFLKLGIIAGYDSEERKEYIKTRAYHRWHFHFIDSLWGAHCRGCGAQLKGIPTFSKPEHIYCSNKCAQSSPEVVQSRERAFLQNYGVTHPSKDASVKRKIRDTMYARHGGYTLASKSLKKKVDATNIERYGSKYLMQNPEILQKSLGTQVARFGGVGMGSKVLRSKAKRTYLDRNGVDHQFKDPVVREKSKTTMRKRYGADHPMQSPEILKRLQETNLERYGVCSTMSLQSTKDKVRATMQDRYGVDSPMQNPASREKQQRSARRITSHVIEGRVFEVQSGAELEVAKRLVSKFGVRHVHSQFHQQFPDYVFSECGTFPDFYVDRTDTFVEVKSDWTFFGRKGKHQRSLTEGSLKVNRRKARTANEANVVRWIVVSRSGVHVLPRDWFDTMTEAQLRKLITPRHKSKC